MVATTAEALRAQIIGRYEHLSKRLQQVASHAIDHPSDFALETLTTIAKRSGVQPSTIVRFAKEFGFDGASSMQRLFRDQLVSSPTDLGYRQRVRRMEREADKYGAPDVTRLLEEFVASSSASLKILEQPVTVAYIEATIAAIQKAEMVYVVGFRRSFSISSYISYALGRTGKRVCSVDGLGGMHAQQIAGAGQRDLVIATTFAPYADETLAICGTAASAGVPIHVLTDSELCPLSQFAAEMLAIRDAEIRGFRSLLATQLVAQTILVGYLYAVEQQAAT
jgi:DNA-binding MurR/RpiR family transcriptional regulator